MVGPAERCSWVTWVRDAYQDSERRACRATGVARSTIRYRSRRPSQEHLRRRLRKLAGTRVSYGYKRLHIVLCREGWTINHKRVYRLYCPYMDFVHDTLADGGSIRAPGVLDVHTRECGALVAARGFRGEAVARVLSRVRDGRGLPSLIQLDNGTEFTSLALDHWAYWNWVTLDFSRPGKPNGQRGDQVVQCLAETRVCIAVSVSGSRSRPADP